MNRLVHAVRGACRSLQGLIPRGRPGVTILAYHLVGGDTVTPVDLPEPCFRQQMSELQELGTVIPLSRALAFLEGREPLLGDRVVVTFDDAYANFDQRARPILEELGVPATLFVPTDFVDKRSPGPLSGAESLPPMSWDRLRSLAQGDLIELGSHSRSHPDLRALGRWSLEREIHESAEIIAARVGVDPDVFCYPRGLLSTRVEKAVSGRYRAALAGGGRKNRPEDAQLCRLQRVSIRCDGPVTLANMLGAEVALEEWIADRVRRGRQQ